MNHIWDVGNIHFINNIKNLSWISTNTESAKLQTIIDARKLNHIGPTWHNKKTVLLYHVSCWHSQPNEMAPGPRLDAIPETILRAKNLRYIKSVGVKKFIDALTPFQRHGIANPTKLHRARVSIRHSVRKACSVILKVSVSKNSLTLFQHPWHTKRCQHKSAIQHSVTHGY